MKYTYPFNLINSAKKSIEGFGTRCSNCLQFLLLKEFQFFNGYSVTVIWFNKFLENLGVKYLQLADLLQKIVFEDFCNVHKQHNLNEHVHITIY